MIRAEIEKYANWQTVLAPRLILGIWHVSGSGQEANVPLLTKHFVAQVPATCPGDLALPPSLRDLDVDPTSPTILFQQLPRLLAHVRSTRQQKGRGVQERVQKAQQGDLRLDREWQRGDDRVCPMGRQEHHLRQTGPMASHQEGHFGKPKGGIEANFDNLCLAVLAEEELLVRIRELPRPTPGQPER